MTMRRDLLSWLVLITFAGRLPAAVRGAGHSQPGYTVFGDGFAIDTATLRGIALSVRIPGQADHRFRRKPITHSDSSRSPIPDEPDQRFRSQADHFSAMTGIVPGVRCEGARGAG